MDPSALHNSIQQEHYQIKTPEEKFADLAGCEYFSTLDATSGFFTNGIGGKEQLRKKRKTQQNPTLQAI